MKRFMTFGAALIMGSSLLAGPAVAQMNSIPVYFNPKGGTGLMVAADLGRGINAESGKNTAVAFRTALGIGPLTIGGGIGIFNPVNFSMTDSGRETQTQYMGNVALRVLGGGLLPVSITASNDIAHPPSVPTMLTTTISRLNRLKFKSPSRWSLPSTKAPGRGRPVS